MINNKSGCLRKKARLTHNRMQLVVYSKMIECLLRYLFYCQAVTLGSTMLAIFVMPIFFMLKNTSANYYWTWITNETWTTLTSDSKGAYILYIRMRELHSCNTLGVLYVACLSNILSALCFVLLHTTTLMSGVLRIFTVTHFVFKLWTIWDTSLRGT